MYGKKILLALLVGVLAFALVIPAVAQDATATPDASGSTGTTGTTDTSMQGTGTLSCDSSVILLAGLAQRYFGYMPSDVTLGSYVYGQYSPLFDMQGMTTMPSAEATVDASGAVVEPTVDPAASSVNPTLAPNAVFLNPPVITGEDPACTQLRMSLESFFATRLQSSDWDTQFRSGLSGSMGNG